MDVFDGRTITTVSSRIHHLRPRDPPSLAASFARQDCPWDASVLGRQIVFTVNEKNGMTPREAFAASLSRIFSHPPTPTEPRTSRSSGFLVGEREPAAPRLYRPGELYLGWSHHATQLHQSPRVADAKRCLSRPGRRRFRAASAGSVLAPHWPRHALSILPTATRFEQGDTEPPSSPKSSARACGKTAGTVSLRGGSHGHPTARLFAILRSRSGGPSNLDDMRSATRPSTRWDNITRAKPPAATVGLLNFKGRTFAKPAALCANSQSRTIQSSRQRPDGRNPSPTFQARHHPGREAPPTTGRAGGWLRSRSVVRATASFSLQGGACKRWPVSGVWTAYRRRAATHAHNPRGKRTCRDKGDSDPYPIRPARSDGDYDVS